MTRIPAGRKFHFRFSRAVAGAVCLCLALGASERNPVLAREDPTRLMADERLQLLSDELSGELAKDHVIEITRHHRIQGSRGYSEAAVYVLNTLRGFGFGASEAFIESFESDGTKTYQTWQSPSGWSIDSAQLSMVAPFRETLVRFPEIPMSVITYSNAGQVRAELVDAGAGVSDSDYEGLDVSGKVVLATGYGGEVHRQAVLKRGAAAVVCYLDDQRAALHPDMIQYTGMWPRTEEIPRVAFGFNISNRQGRKLKALLASGKRVVLDARVNGTGLEKGRMDVVVADIEGSDPDPQTLLFTAHLDHPKESANDNASGSAALLDMARTLRKLIGEGKLPRPQRSIRFLWVPEFFGTMAYIDAHPEIKGPGLGGKFLANLNLDMVGENLELVHSRLNISWMPASLSGVIGDVAAAIAAQVDQIEFDSHHGEGSVFNYRVTPFRGGSDHVVFGDGAIQIPSMMLGHWPDYTHHTTEDSPDKVDPGELERCELIALASFWHLANLNEEQSHRLAAWTASNAQSRLLRDAQKAAAWLMAAPAESAASVYQDAKQVLDFARRRELATLANILDFAPMDSTRGFVETWSQTLERQTELQRRTLLAVYQRRFGRFPAPPALNDEQTRASRRVPTRTTRGPLGPGLPGRLLPEGDRAWHDGPEARALDSYLLVNLIDGERSVLEIRDDLTAATQPVPLASVERYIRDLAKAGLVEIGNR